VIILKRELKLPIGSISAVDGASSRV